MLRDYTFVFDIDGTLCPIKEPNEKYEDLVPYPEMAARLRAYHEAGAKIVLYTSRNMKTYSGNIGQINKYTAPVMLEWLRKWEIPYDEIIFGKIWPGAKGFYVDDRTVRPDEFLTHTPEELDKLCKRSRCSSRKRTTTKKLEIVITMGGLGSRFRKAGYTMPKYMIKAKGKTLFEWSLLSLEGYRDVAEQYIFIAKKDEEHDIEKFIAKQCVKLNITNYRVILIDYLTDGQATTALLAQKYWKEDNALLIYNIDTYVEPGLMNSKELKGDGFIPCFKAQGDHWSFVRLDETGKVVEIREKVRISDNCTLGAYYFKSCALYTKLYNEYYGGRDATQFDKGEKYVAPLYNYLLQKGGEIFISCIDPRLVHVLGTPEELQVFLNE